MSSDADIGGCSLLKLTNSRRLELLQTGEFGDCTLRVGFGSDDDLSTYKDYKLHKEILSLASDVFKAMFRGGFKEAKIGPDEPILLKEVDPPVFECTMSFVYGQEKHFESVAFAMQVYTFADRMQMEILMNELDKYFKQCAVVSEFFALFEMYRCLGREEGLLWCRKQALAENTDTALLSEHWLNLRLDSILDFLGSGSDKNVVEEQLAASVVEWGKFQVEADGGDPQHGPSLRAKILPAINLIEFTEVPPKNFAKLCQRELGAALSVGEKLAIFKSMTDGTIWKRTSGRLRILSEECGSWVMVRDGAEYSAHLTFKIYIQAKVSEPNLLSCNGWRMTRCELRDSDGNVVIESGSFNDSEYILASGTNYTFVMNFSCQLNVDEEERYFQTHRVPANTNVCLCGYCLTVVSCSKFFGNCGFDVRLEKAFKYP